MWTEARARGFTLADVARWMAQRPRALAGLDRKGGSTPRPGRRPRGVRTGPDFVVDPARLRHRNPITPYAGRTLTGVVRSTWLRGQRILAQGEPCGQLISRGEA